MFMKKITIMTMIYTLLLLGSWGWFLYVDNKPKTSIDLTEQMLISQDLSGLIAPNASISESDFESFRNYFSGEGPLKISQYTLLEYEDNFLLIQTNPGLVNKQLYIQDIRSVDVNEFKHILEEE